MTQAVLCEVSNCVFNLEGQKCSASEIMVVSQQGNSASNKEETDCQTFEPKH